LVPFNDQVALVEAVKRVLDYPETKERIIQTARARSKEFSEEVMIKNITAVLQKIYEESI
jgi:glycosyltransferase involved in cell wall biosynthesis